MRIVSVGAVESHSGGTPVAGVIPRVLRMRYAYRVEAMEQKAPSS